MTQDITLAIMVKDKEKTLPLYLECIENQTYPKDKIHLWIRSNNNNDNSIEILQNWVQKNKHLYKSVYEDYSDSSVDITKYKNHEWNADRFSVLGAIRQQSVQYAIDNNSNYFVADCDNFIKPFTLENLYNTNLPVVGPYLQLIGKLYSNFHHKADDIGYFKSDDQYHWIHSQSIRGLIQVDVIHCTYFIKNEALSKIQYLDGSGRHEYVIFSDYCRKNNIQQYIDNRHIYGFITFCEENQKIDLNYFKFLINN